MKQCAFCGVASRYKCPKCLRDYCSVECYKCEAHLECSERFYRDCFIEGLKEDGMGGGEDRDEVTEMLKGLAGVDNSMPDEDLERIFKSLKLGKDSEEVWEMLENEEKTAFISMHSRQDFTPIITTWQPWWKLTIPKLIQDDNQLESLTKSIPKVFIAPSINHLIPHKAPSPTIPFDIINTLYGYCYVCRLHNGDLNDLLIESAHAILSISNSLLSQTFDFPLSSIDHCMYNLNKSQAAEACYVSDEFSVAVINDVVSVLSAGSSFKAHLFTKAALSHLRGVFRKACKVVKKDGEDSAMRDTFLKAFKKLEFYLSWMEGNGGMMDGLASLLEVVLHAKMTELNKRGAERSLIENHMHRLRPGHEKKLIEEL